MAFQKVPEQVLSTILIFRLSVNEERYLVDVTHLGF